MKSTLRTGFLLASMFGSAAFAQAPYRCESGDIVRRVEIVYESDAPVPCEVHYVKETEAPGSREVLWNAQNETGYCELRARELVARLGTLGWSCSGGSPEQAADDSTVLSPVEESEQD